MGAPQSEREQAALVAPRHPVYVKALTLRELVDVERIKLELLNGHILIVKISQIAKRNPHETKVAINLLVDFVRARNGDIGRLGEERIVLTPAAVRIWRRTEPIKMPRGAGYIDEEK
jgi:hypothetical protein